MLKPTILSFVALFLACGPTDPCPSGGHRCEGGAGGEGGSGVATDSAIGSPCSVSVPCSIGTCSAGICKGGDGDPCPLAHGTPALGDTSLCLNGYACHTCSVAIFGAYECACSGAPAATGCASAVCLSPFDACSSTAGHTWNAVTQTCL